jgi:hypothetical protein
VPKVNEDPLGLNELENAINEISQLNIDGLPKIKSLEEKIKEVPKPEILQTQSTVNFSTHTTHLQQPMVELKKKKSFDPDSYLLTEDQLE